MSQGKETILKDNAFLVSETDKKGNIIFANEEFSLLAEYKAEELLNKAHNIVRHEDMPKLAFEELWTTVKKGKVWQGHVKNKTSSGGYYWVFATVYPYKNEEGEQCYMSIRRKATKANIEKFSQLYKTMR